MKTNLKYIVVAVVSLLTNLNVQSQCTVTISPDPITIDCGETVDLTALGLSTTPALSTNFNGGAIGAGWQTSATLLFTDPCGPSLDGTPSAWFGNVPLPRTLTTNGFDLSCGGQVCFDLDFAADDAGNFNDCEDPDQADEGVFFQYSVTGVGGPWIDIQYFDPQPNFGAGTNPIYNWATYCFILPPGAWTNNTMFRWSQPNATSSLNDHWGIDNVNIYPSDCNYWYDWANIPGAPDNMTQTVSPLTTTVYDVVYTDGTNACNASVTVVVNDLIIDATAVDTLFCPGVCTDLNAMLLNPPTNICNEVETATGSDQTTNIVWNAFPCVPGGATITSISLDASTTGLCTAWSAIDIIVNGITISANQCNVVALDLTPFLPITSVVIQSIDNDAFNDNITLNAILSITYTTNPVYNYAWTPAAGLNNANIQNPNACPTATTTYTATLTEANSGCTATDDVTITITPIPVVSNVVATCIGSTGYTVTFDVAGGTGGPYTVTENLPGGTGGAWAGTTWTSNLIASGATYDFDIDDASGCGPVNITGMLSCGCATDAGTMDVTPLTLCESVAAVTTHNNDSVNDGNDAMVFVLHDNAGAALGTIFATNTTPTFNFSNPPLAYGTTYYISAVVGDDDLAGGVDYADPCLSVAIGTPVVWTEEPTADLSGIASICNGANANLTIAFTGTGPFDIVYSDGTSNFNLNGVTSPHVFAVSPTVTTVYTLISVVDAVTGCVGTVTFDANVTVNNPPVVSNIVTVCNGTNTGYTLSFDVTGGNGGPYTVTENLPGGVGGTWVGNTWTSNLILSGAAYDFDIDDVNGCGPININGSTLCNCTTDAGTMDLTPLVLCENDQAITTHNADSTLDANDNFIFILHDNNGGGAGTIFATSATPTFNFANPPLTFGTTYYISSVAGDDDLAGGVDLSDPCLSVAIGTPVTWYPIPAVADQAPAAMCEDPSGSGSVSGIDLTTWDAAINTGSGNTVNWFTDMNLTIPVVTSTNVTVTNGLIFYAQVDNGNCMDTATITFTVIPMPAANDQTPAAICEDVFGGGTVTGIDLTLLEAAIDGGGGSTFTWFSDALLTTAVPTPTNVTVSNGLVFYTFIDNGSCNDTAMVTYTVDPLPVANPQNPSTCEDILGTGVAAGMDLTTLDALVNGGTANIVTWYDNTLTLIPVPTNVTVSNGQIFFAEVSDGVCTNVATVTYNVTSTITLVDPMPSFCEDVAGSASVAGIDLTSFETSVYGGAGTFTWYNDAALTSLVGNPTNLTVVTGVSDQFFVNVVSGNCNNSIAVNFTVIPLPTAIDQTPAAMCEDAFGTGNVVGIDLTALEGAMNGTGASFSWFIDAALTLTVTTPTNVTVTNGLVFYALIDDGTCSDTAIVTYTVNPMPVANNQTPAALCEDATGLGTAGGVDLTALNVSISGGIGSIYNWYNDAALTSAVATPNNVTVSDGQVFYVEIDDGNCTNVATVTYTVNSKPIAIDQFPAALCEDVAGGGAANVDLTASNSGVDGGAGNSVTWYVDVTLATPVIPPTGFASTNGQIFYALVSNGNCVDTAIATVTINPKPNVEFLVDEIGACETDDQVFTFHQVNPSATDSTLTWDFGSGGAFGLGSSFPEPNADTVTNIYPANPSVYDVTLTITTTAAAGNCSNSYTEADYITIYQNPVADFTMNPNPATMLDPTIDFMDQSMSFASPFTLSYAWNIGGLDSSFVQNPTYLFPEDTGNYSVYLTVTDAHGCTNTTVNTAIVKGEFGIYIPNAFSPDGNGVNDYFYPKGFGITDRDFSFFIFDRWGEILFESHSLTLSDGWDGTYKGKIVANGTYVWKVIFHDINGIKHDKVGHVSILR